MWSREGVCIFMGGFLLSVLCGWGEVMKVAGFGAIRENDVMIWYDALVYFRCGIIGAWSAYS